MASVADTPSGKMLQCLRSRDAKAEIRLGQVNANRVTNFIKREGVVFPKEILYLIITSTFQVWDYLGFGRCLLRAPLRSLVMKGCWPTEKPSIFRWVDERVEQRMLTDWYARPSLKTSVKKIRMSLIYEEKGSVFHLEPSGTNGSN